MERRTTGASFQFLHCTARHFKTRHFEARHFEARWLLTCASRKLAGLPFLSAGRHTRLIGCHGLTGRMNVRHQVVYSELNCT